ncbi:hypothetical protein L0337_33985 [candidate division KSB1 bacterium]|nr:hypothetical protein [candidate division KSB1 bacterium]
MNGVVDSSLLIEAFSASVCVAASYRLREGGLILAKYQSFFPNQRPKALRIAAASFALCNKVGQRATVFRCYVLAPSLKRESLNAEGCCSRIIFSDLKMSSAEPLLKGMSSSYNIFIMPSTSVPSISAHWRSVLRPF